MIALERFRHHTPGQHRTWIAVGLAVLVILLAIPFGLGALGTFSGTSGSPAPAGGRPVGRSDGAGPDFGAISPGAPGVADGSGREGTSADGRAPGAAAGPDVDAVTPLGSRLARTAWLGVRVADLTAASTRVRAIAAAAGGQVLSESIVTAADPTVSRGASEGAAELPGDVAVAPVGLNEARITLSVPADQLDSVLDDLSAASLGTVSYRSSRSEDVTETYVDTQARIQPARDSIARVRALMVKATALDQIVLLESELARRQADLDSLEQRLAELDRRTTTSTVSVTLWTDATVSPAPGENWFRDSLAKAWEAFLGSIMVVITGLAVLLPWLLIAAVIAWLVRRWLRHRGGGAAPAAD